MASRLEGVNKQYGTYIIASENTIKETGDKLLSRQLGWIRVVGVNKPLRIYEILDLYSDAPQALHTLVEFFHSAPNLFEAGKWNEAETAFKRVLEIFPEDGPSCLYLNRCRLFFDNPPSTDWDGVFDMKEK